MVVDIGNALRQSAGLSSSGSTHRMRNMRNESYMSCGASTEHGFSIVRKPIGGQDPLVGDECTTSTSCYDVLSDYVA